YGSALMRALEFEREEMAFALLDAGSAVPDHALGLAARGGLDRFVTLLLDRGMSPDGGDSWGYTPLHSAAKYNHVSTIELLLKRGAKPSVNATNDGFTPLHLAVIDRRLEAVKILIATKADLEARDDRGRTALHWGPFAYAPQPKHMYAKLGEPHDTVWVDPGPAVVIEMLLDAGAKIDARDKGGNTPLHAATNIGSVRGVEMLLKRGADKNAVNDKGQKPIFHAKRRGDDDIKEMIEKVR
ncbi:MAG: ankyrin repeat domain-containing protein, partial [Deltaproteobacteria bacterium]|nr:ankyrin repeat domain-containing protein [Deltaproteobacteria bacterium]